MHGKSVSPEFGRRVAALRTAGKIKQADLADRIGVASTALSEWENDKRLPDDPNVLVRLAEELGCSLDYLLRDEEGLQEIVRRRLEDLLAEIGPSQLRRRPDHEVFIADTEPEPAGQRESGKRRRVK